MERITRYYRHPIRTYDFTELDGKDRWTAYKFIKNVYDVWTLKHLARICSIIDRLPLDIDFEVSSLSETSGLSQELTNRYLSQRLREPESSSEGPTSRSESTKLDATPITSFTNPNTSKEPKNAGKRNT